MKPATASHNASTSGISIRTANLADATRLAELGQQTFHETFAADTHPADIATYLDQVYTLV